MNVTICDLHGQPRSQVMVQNERQYISSYLGIIVTIGLSGTVTEIQTCNIFVTMVTFLKDVFHLFFAGMYCCYDFFCKREHHGSV